jgi:dTDP-4-amino-4,6-dideoxygalactose transaminase
MIPLFKVNVETEECLSNVAEVLKSGYIGEGEWVELFESRLKSYWQSERRVLALNSCTSALELALHMCEVKDDYVISTPQTCTASNTAIISRGGKILWADVDQFTGNITADSVGKLIDKYGERVRAILCVDWGGTPVDYDEIRKVASGIPIIEDAAHSFLTLYKSKHISNTGGDYVAWSFQAIKHLTTGDGGALVVPVGMEKRAELLKWYGLDRKSSQNFRCSQTIGESGFKFQMNNIAAAIGIANMTKAVLSVFDSQIQALRYSEELAIGKRVVYVPLYDARSSYWIYTILVEDRDAFIKYLEVHDIAASPVHARNDRHPCFPPKTESPEDRKGIDYFSARNVAIPCGWWVTDQDQTRIIEIVNKWNSL